MSVKEQQQQGVGGVGEKIRRNLSFPNAGFCPKLKLMRRKSTGNSGGDSNPATQPILPAPRHIPTRCECEAAICPLHMPHPPSSPGIDRLLLDKLHLYTVQHNRWPAHDDEEEVVVKVGCVNANHQSPPQDNQRVLLHESDSDDSVHTDDSLFTGTVGTADFLRSFSMESLEDVAGGSARCDRVDGVAMSRLSTLVTDSGRPASNNSRDNDEDSDNSRDNDEDSDNSRDNDEDSDNSRDSDEDSHANGHCYDRPAVDDLEDEDDEGFVSFKFDDYPDSVYELAESEWAWPGRPVDGGHSPPAVRKKSLCVVNPLELYLDRGCTCHSHLLNKHCHLNKSRS